MDKLNERFTLLAWTIFVSTIIFSVCGIILRSKLHNGIECDMSWSRVRFVILPDLDRDDNISIHHNKYRLLKFIDGADSRYSHLIDYTKPEEKIDGGQTDTFGIKDNSLNWCQTNSKKSNTGHIVLYIPGHGGQYSQSRSLGVHGINLALKPDLLGMREKYTIMDKLKNGTMSSQAKDINNFLYDVYTLDFQGEGAGLHASKIFSQAEFAVKSIERIHEQCSDSFVKSNETHFNDERKVEITIVAHSIGGIVARKSIIMLNEKRKELRNNQYIVKNLITLASPHSTIPFVLDYSVFDFHSSLVKEEDAVQLNQQIITKGSNDATIISISGGLRDELIPQQSSIIKTGFSYLGTDIMPPNRQEIKYEGSEFGMDHKAIVWCHGLLQSVRGILHIIATSHLGQNHLSSDTKKIREEKINNYLKGKIETKSRGLTACSSQSESNNIQDTCGYNHRLKQKELLLIKEYGWLGSFATKTLMMYNSQALVFLYFINSILSQLALLVSRRIKNERLFEIFPVLAYTLLPIVSSQTLFLSIILGKKYFTIILNQIYYVDDNKTLVMLSYIAMTIYFLILYGIVPVMVKALTYIREIEESNFKWSIRYQFVNSVFWLCVSVLIHSITLWVLSKAQLFEVNDMVWNMIAAKAHAFIILNIFILVKGLFDCGMNMMKKKDLSDNKHKFEFIGKQLQRRMYSILVFTMFPLFLFGKLVYALSLLTLNGQHHAMPYINYRKDQWRTSRIALIFSDELICFICFSSMPLFLLSTILCRGQKIKEEENVMKKYS